MEQKNNNGQNSVATSADFNNIITAIGSICPEFIKYFLNKYGYMDLRDGVYLNYADDDDAVLRVHYPNGNWFNVVKNHSVGSRCNWKFIAEQVKDIMCRHYNVPNPKHFATFNDWAEDLLEYGFCGSEKRMAKIRAQFSMAAEMNA